MLVIKINGVNFDPSEMEIGVQDVSASEAGRDQRGVMQKMLISSKFKIRVAWREPSRALTAQILTAVKPEYFQVQFWNPETNSLTTRTMYVGDRSAMVRMWGDARAWYSKVEFNLIER